jgi:endonuclease/exonuclease/phosphatase family metal-dependent hydrolase
MAAINEPYPFSSFPLTSYETALCIIPPLHQCNEIDRLRNLYDKAWGRWPPHINLIYPFVSPNLLPQAKAMVEAKLASVTLSSNAIILNAPGTSSHRANHTVFLSEATTSSDNSGPLAVLRSAVLEVLGQPTSPSKFHLTVGQPVDETDSTKNFLLSKVGLLPEFEVPIQYLVILLRERTSTRTQDPGVIRLWCTIDIPGNCLGRPTSSMSEFWLPVRGKSESQIQSELDDGTLQVGTTETLRDVYLDHGIQSGTTYQYNTSGDNWTPCLEPISPITAGTRLKVSSYNVLKDSVHPPALERDAMLLQAILSEPASSDILVLQEVSDPFLTYLLSVAQIQRQYPFVSHGPPHQQNIGLLPSLHNVLVLSRYHFTWELIPFRRGHKGASVAIFNFNRENNSPLERLIVAGIHLTYDLTDESVAAKKTQLHDLVKHLNQHYPKEPWIIAGDFNISTSSHTISTAVQNRAISRQTTITLASIEMMLADAGLVDTWSISRVEDADETATNSEELCEGEDGATFNPMEKRLAAAISGTSSNRPERYDRILARCQNTLRITHFNQFGLDDHDGVQVAPSDHYGIRATINVVAEGNPRDEPGMLKKRSVIAKRVPAQLAESSALESTLANHHMLPTAEEIELRKKAFSLLKEVLLGFSVKRRPELSDVPLVIVPVGSYALGVWTSASDIDCLCIGSISSTTFFSMARHRIRRAEPRGIRLLRKVEANTGTMYELSVNGINMHMQYCPAAQIVER